MKRWLGVAFVAVYAVSVWALDDARLLRQPDIFGNRIVFSYAGDIWTVSAEGGLARKLTTYPGVESGPLFSPDGKWIAFTARYDGNTDVYIIPATGGEPRRLTCHPGSDVAVSWTPDGKSVVFTSSRENFSRQYRLFRISVDGVFPERIPVPQGSAGQLSPDGSQLAYNPLPARVFRAWRRYRGGSAPYIWIMDTKSLDVESVPRTDSNDVYPFWMDGAVVFLSDRDRVMNLYRYRPGSGKVEQLTRFTGADIKTWGTDGRRIVFEREGRLSVMDGPNATPVQIRVDVPDERLNTRPRFVKAASLIYSAAVSPTGKRVAFGARGEIVTVPAEKGNIRNITNTPGVMERNPAWSPDGKWIAYFGEKDGEYAIFIRDQKGLTAPKIYDVPEPTFFYDLVWSPDSKKLAFNDVRQNLYVLDTATGAIETVDTDPEFLHYPRPAWSPDSRWLAYRLTGSNGFGLIMLYELASGKKTPVTDGLSDADHPVFSPDGKYLYFSASTDLAQDVAWLDMSEYPHHPTRSLYVAVLSAEAPSPFAPESDEEPVGKKEKKSEDGKKKKADDGEKKKEMPTRIDLDGIRDRIVSIDVPAGRYSGLRPVKDALFYLENKPGTRGMTLHRYDMKKRKDNVLGDGVSSFLISADGKKLVFRKKSKYLMVDVGKKLKDGKPLATERIETWCDPKQEYRQILHEAWRINRDFFYDPGMHGHDWAAIWKKYEAWLPYVSHRDDLNYLIQMMIGEYTCGHAYNGGGMQPEVGYVPGGLLGADFTIENGRYRITRIYRGEHWNPDLHAPLAGPGLNVREGDYILSINGRPLSGNENIYGRLVKTAGKQVTLKVGPSPDGTGARTVTVVPVASEFALRHRQWIEDNRRKVDELSSGKVGYVYMPNTGAQGFRYFNRYFFAALDKPAIVIDERFNGGGYVADYVINMLNRPLLSWWQPRYGRPFKSPNSGHFGPKVMLINEYAGSGGDFMPWAFRETGIGKLIGKRTWGGLVGISGYPPLMDGGYVTAPSFGIVSKDGEFIIENHGVDPDIEVDILPKDFVEGRDPQLEAAVKEVLGELNTKKPPVFHHNGFPRGR